MKDLNETAVYIIVAMTKDGVIGNDGGLPWRIPEEIAVFKKLTTGHTVVMGRHTYQSIGHPLTDRINIVVSNKLSAMPGLDVVKTPDEALQMAKNLHRKIFIIGGAELYRATLPQTDYLYISWIKEAFPGNVKFPQFDLNNWLLVQKEDFSDFTLCLYSRRFN